MEQPPVGVEQHIPLVVLLACGGVARNLRHREAHSLAAHRPGEQGALRGIDRIRGHVDEFDAGGGQAEGIVGHRQIDAARHRLQQEADAGNRGIDILRRGAEHEGGGLRLAGRDGTARDRIGETAVGHELPGVEERQQRIELALSVPVAPAVEILELLPAAADHREIAQHFAVKGERRALALHREVIDAPRQLPDEQHGDEQSEEYSAESGHGFSGFTEGISLVCRP